MKKTLVVVNNICEGGLTHVLLDFIAVLSEYCQVTVLSIYDLSEIYKWEIKQKAEYVTIDNYRNKFKNQYIRSINSRMMDNRRIQQILFNLFLHKHYFDYEIAFAEDWAICLVAQSQTKSKKLAWVHTDFLCNGVLDSQQDIKKYKTLLSSFHNVVFVSDALRKKFEQILGLTQTVTIANAVDINKIQYNLRSAPFIVHDPHKVNLVYLGRLSHEKGVDRLLNSVSRLPQNMKDKWTLSIIGDGDQRTMLCRIVQEKGLEKNVFFCGLQKQPQSAFNNATALLLPSRYEGFGLVLVEAMAVGLPVIATNTVGASEVLDNGHYGVLLPNEDNAFDDVLLSVINNPSMLEKYKPLSLERANAYSISAFAKNIKSIVS